MSLPSDGEYVTVRGGHLSCRGKRVRYWCAIGNVLRTAGVTPADSAATRSEKAAKARRGTDAIIDRLLALGFNGVRFWETTTDETYRAGDGTDADGIDYFVARSAKKGLKIWSAGLNDVGRATAADVDIVDSPETKSAWISAIGDGVDLRNNVARIWDPRLEAIALRRMRAVATHQNKHTNLRWCDDPAFFAWELSNEEWWISRMLGGGWQRLPAFFRNSLVSKFNAFLTEKYATSHALSTAWNGLLTGETLERQSVLLTPMRGELPAAVSLNDANPQAAAALSSLKQAYNRDDFSPQRGSDVLEFLVGLQLSHKKREADAVKSWGKGTKLCPLVWDTGIGYEIQSQFLHQHGDAVAHDAYVNGTGPDFIVPDTSRLRTEMQRRNEILGAERISANSGPWVNWLRKPPGISQGVPWLEHNRVEGKPFFCYETQIQQPARYRADFPLRIAALAAIQDWDVVCWHYFQAPGDIAEVPRPFDRAMDITTGGHPQGYHFTFDEVQSAMLRAAGTAFLNFAHAPAPRPTTFVYGKRSLYDPDSMDYAGSYGPDGFDMLQTVYQHGARVKIDPTRDDNEVRGPVVKFADRGRHNPYAPTREIIFDWRKGFVSLDSAKAKAWTGFLAETGGEARLDGGGIGLVLRDVRITNPREIFEPMLPRENYVAFSLYSRDGLPLSRCKRASLSLVSTSYNDGFSLRRGERISGGEFPARVARVGATIRSAALRGMRYVFYDWHFQEIGRGTVSGDSLVFPAALPIFVVELTR